MTTIHHVGANYESFTIPLDNKRLVRGNVLMGSTNYRIRILRRVKRLSVLWFFKVKWVYEVQLIGKDRNSYITFSDIKKDTILIRDYKQYKIK